MTDHKAESTAFGELLGLIEVRGLSPSAAVDVATSEFDTADEATYQELVAEHWDE